jgi:hypothetical protein
MEHAILGLLSSPDEKNIILGAQIAETTLFWSFEQILYTIIENVNDADFMLNQDQEEICKMCEDEILGCCSNSSTYQCEGCKCEQAWELFIESHFENLIA